jgi:hypothetical protein
MGAIRSYSKVFTITPTITSTPYSAGDTVGTVNTLSGATFKQGPDGAGGSDQDRGVCTIGSISVIDTEKESVELDIFFFSQSPTIPADNAAWELNAANSAHYIGHVTIETTDYVNSTSRSFACVRGLGLIVSPEANESDLYCVVVTRGTPTYAAGSLILKIGVYQE